MKYYFVIWACLSLSPPSVCPLRHLVGLSHPLASLIPSSSVYYLVLMGRRRFGTLEQQAFLHSRYAAFELAYYTSPAAKKLFYLETKNEWARRWVGPNKL